MWQAAGQADGVKLKAVQTSRAAGDRVSVELSEADR